MTTKFLQQALKRSKKSVKNGFTLIELMVVVAIVGVLSSVGVPQLLKAQDKAKDAAAIATLTNAAKECSLVLVTEGGDGTNFDIDNYSTANNAVTGTCEVDTEDALELVSEASDARTASVDFDAGGIPSPAAFPDAGDGDD